MSLFPTLRIAKRLQKSRRSRAGARARLRLGGSSETPQILEGIQPGAVAISPSRLERVTADHLPADQLKARWSVADIRARDISEDIRLAAARGAGAGPAKTFERQIRFQAVVPAHGQFIADQLHIRQFKRHQREVMDSRRQIKPPWPVCRNLSLPGASRNGSKGG